jgi:hypothetical protein
MPIVEWFMKHTTGIDQSLAKHLLDHGLWDRLQAD